MENRKRECFKITKINTVIKLYIETSTEVDIYLNKNLIKFIEIQIKIKLVETNIK